MSENVIVHVGENSIICGYDGEETGQIESHHDVDVT